MLQTLLPQDTEQELLCRDNSPDRITPSTVTVSMLSCPPSLAAQPCISITGAVARNHLRPLFCPVAPVCIPSAAAADDLHYSTISMSESTAL